MAVGNEYANKYANPYLSDIRRPSGPQTDYERDNVNDLDQLFQKWPRELKIPRSTRMPPQDVLPQFKKSVLFRVDTQHFLPSETEVTIADGHVVIHGKHSEHMDEHGLVAREFTRRYRLPEDIDPDTVEATCDVKGILAVFAEKSGASDRNVRIVPVKPVRSNCTAGSSIFDYLQSIS